MLNKSNDSLLNNLSEGEDKKRTVEMMDAECHRYRLIARRLLILMLDNS